MDVGHGQLHERLRDDPRVVGVEGLNARAMTPSPAGRLRSGLVRKLVKTRGQRHPARRPYSWMRNGGAGR